MRVHLPRIGVGEFTDLPVDAFEERARLDRVGRHELTTSPDEADLILFSQCHMVDWRLTAIRNHDVARKYRNKVMVYDERDRPWRSFPGVYVSVPASSFDYQSQRAWSYLGPPDTPRESAEPDLLFSFIGSPTSECRRAIFGLRHPDAVIEEVRDFMFWDTAQTQYAARRRRFREVLARSRFVLCPRGRGTSSIRLYETLAAGRVPVIISDEWVAPAGPDWEEFCLRWPENALDGLVEVIEEHDQNWSRMRCVAARAHSEYFAPDVIFDRIIGLCESLMESCALPSSRVRVAARSFASALRVRVKQL